MDCVCPCRRHIVCGASLLRCPDIPTGSACTRASGGRKWQPSLHGQRHQRWPEYLAEAQYLLNKWSAEDHSRPFNELSQPEKIFLESRLQEFLHKNTYDPDSKILVIHSERYEAFEYNKQHYSGLFMEDPELDELRAAYAIAKNSIKSEERMEKMAIFFFWASWACVTERPGSDVTYTHNWPPDEQIGNVATSDLVLWTGFSIIMLLVGIGIMIFVQARTKQEEILKPVDDPLMNQTITPSMWAVQKYFWVVNLLILAQVLLGVITAHYGVEGDGFYGIDIAQFIPYSITRTWHIQLAIFWIATSWLATGLYIAPSLSGRDPKWQKTGVNMLFVALLIVVAAFLFTRMGLLGIKSATNNVLFATIIFLTGGILGTFHHLYFTGTPTGVMALGATFSALEVVPLVLIGFEAYHNYRMSRATEWLRDYKWPIYFLLSVAFWNFLGAGIFGFIINPPIALYYMQGLNTTPVHGHAALFGVYGMLGIGLILFVLRSMYRKVKWNDKLISFTFWSLNIGLFLMVFLSLLPVGLMQTVAIVKEGMWFARSAEFMQQPVVHVFKWLRVVGDTIFAVGTLTLFWFVYTLTVQRKRK